MILGEEKLFKKTCNQNNLEIDLSKIESALYFVKINTANDSIIKRVVKE